MSNASERIFTIGEGDRAVKVTISGCSEQDADRIAAAFQDLPVELRDDHQLLIELLERAFLEGRRDGKLDAGTVINFLGNSR